MKEMTNALRKQIQSLGEAKHRKKLGLFRAEGTKCVLDTIEHFSVDCLVATSEWIKEHPEVADRFAAVQVSPKEMERISGFSTASQVIAVYKIPEQQFDPEALKNKLSIALDCIQDPGNLGTIIRTADWFGIDTIIASHDTADMYSPKVVQATMGAISRVKVYYCNLPDSLNDAGCPVYGTFLDGESIFSRNLSATGIIVMGNEGRGISEEVARMVNQRLFIPPYPSGAETSESLNVATATAITVAQFRAQQLIQNKSDY